MNGASLNPYGDERLVRMFDYWSLVSNLDDDPTLSVAITIVLQQQQDTAGRATMIRLLGLATPRIDTSAPVETPDPGSPEFASWLARPNHGRRIEGVHFTLGQQDSAPGLILATGPPADVTRLLAVRERLGPVSDRDLTVVAGIARQMIETGTDRIRRNDVPDRSALSRLTAAGIIEADGDGLRFS